MSAWNLVCFVDKVVMSAVKLPGEVKQNNLPPECGQLIEAGAHTLGLSSIIVSCVAFTF
jgi:hypothetical protein